MIDLRRGDCLELLKTLADNSVDSIVTDPPYGLSREPDMAEVLRHWLAGDDYVHKGSGFMGKSWDSFVPGPSVWRECLRVLKPGGHLLAFFGTRTQDMGTLAIRLAGFEIRDSIAWVYGSGFPKSRDVSKAIDAEAGAEREVLGTVDPRGTFDGCERASAAINEKWRGAEGRDDLLDLSKKLVTAPATDAARQWQGWGTALKPALEPITVARKPLIGTVAANVLAHGTGALNIDGCRVPHGGQADGRWGNGARPGGFGNVGAEKGGSEPCGQFNAAGRWPANLIHDGSDEVVELFPAKAGAAAPVHTRNSDKFRNSYGAFAGNVDEAGSTFHGDTGSAARFFKQCERDDYVCESQSHVHSVDAHLSHQSLLDAFARSVAATLGRREVRLLSDARGPFTNATQNELRLIERLATGAMTSIAFACSQGPLPEKLTLTLNHAKCAASMEPTGTMTITVSHWKSDGSADRITFSIMPSNLEAGERGSEQFSDKRLIYCAKASKADRNEGLDDLPDAVLARSCQAQAQADRGITVAAEGGAYNKARVVKNNHPTVKPTALMAYLCRLVTPPGGVVLDPYMGSGTTGKAAVLKGFRFIGFERDEDESGQLLGYLDIARARIEHARWQRAKDEMQADMFGGAA